MGDDFERLYFKYYTASGKTRTYSDQNTFSLLELMDQLPFTLPFRFYLSELIERIFNGFEYQISTETYPFFRNEEEISCQNILEITSKELEPEKQDVSDISIDDFYDFIIENNGISNRITYILVSLKAYSIKFSKSYITYCNSDEMVNVLSEIEELKKKVSDEGGILDITIRSIKIPTPSELAASIANSNNVKIKNHFAYHHINHIYQHYIARGEVNTLKTDAELAYLYLDRIHINGDDLNNLAYIFLSFDDCDKAKILLEKAIATSDENQFIALMHYNLGIVELHFNNTNEAEKLFSTSLKLAEKLENKNNADCACLFIPILINDEIKFIEEFNVSLIKVLEQVNKVFKKELVEDQ